MSKRPPPSAHDVARRAGVSQAAVSRAFTPGASISRSTREKVLSAARDIGYRPNLLARSLIKGESGLIGVVVGTLADALVAAAVDTLSTQLAHAGKHILMFTAHDTAHADQQVEDLLKFRVDAVLLMAATLSADFTERCHREGVRVIAFNRQFGRYPHFPSVVADNRTGAGTLADHMLEQGYRRFGLIGGMPDSPTGHERLTAFTARLKRRNVAPLFTAIGHCNRDGAIRAARDMLGGDQRPDAIFCANDLMAIAALEVARYEFGLQIGRDIGIAGFDDIEQASWPSFDLTTFSHPVQAMTQEVLRILLAGPAVGTVTHKTFSGEFKPRGSTRRG